MRGPRRPEVRAAGTAKRRARVLIEELSSRRGPPSDVAGMARYGIRSSRVLGVRMPEIRRIARRTALDHALARALWDSGVFEARLLAAMVDDPRRVTSRQMDAWAADFDNWAICDGVCHDLFRYSPLAPRKALEWSGADAEFVKRAGFSLIAAMAGLPRGTTDALLPSMLGPITRGSDDDRPYVRKAISWALRRIGGRNAEMHRQAARTARSIARRGTPGARWVAADVLRGLSRPGGSSRPVRSESAIHRRVRRTRHRNRQSPRGP